MGAPMSAASRPRDHAVELLGLRDERPVAADLVQPRQVARAGLRDLAVALISSCMDLKRRKALTFSTRCGMSTGFRRKSSAPAS